MTVSVLVSLSRGVPGALDRLTLQLVGSLIELRTRLVAAATVHVRLAGRVGGAGEAAQVEVGASSGAEAAVGDEGEGSAGQAPCSSSMTSACLP